MPKENSAHDELLTIIDDTQGDIEEVDHSHYWRILVVDDDEDVHVATNLTLNSLVIEDRTLELLHAYSAAEAEALLKVEEDISVVLLDVVMESEHSGLDLVDTIRNDLMLDDVRIVLRTGQPGYAPEMETIKKYDINDYRTKSDLTRIRLFTILTSAIRAYKQIRQHKVMRQGLENVVSASTKMANIHGMRLFAEGAVKQISALIQIEPDGLICAQDGSHDNSDNIHVIAASGRYSNLVQAPLDSLKSPKIKQLLTHCLQQKKNLVDDGLTLYFSTDRGRGIAAYVDIDRPLNSVDQHLLEVFCANLSVGFDNVFLYNKLEEQAYTDPLLKVPNLNYLLKYLCSPIDHSEASLLALIDLDDFSAINDSFGHQFGDSVLKEVINRLTSRFPQCFLARVSSDVFALIGLESEVNSSLIIDTFESEFIVNEQPFKLSASVGLVKLAERTTELTDLFKDAQVALKQAKVHKRGGAMTFSQDMGQCARERIQLLTQLRLALTKNALFLMYQPKYHLETKAITGMEALLRWRTDSGDLIPPDQFIPLAEQSGMMLTIGAFVMQRSCEQLRQLNQAGFEDISMAINISPSQLEDSGFISSLQYSLESTGISPQQLELEITETVAANDFDYICNVLTEVRKLGCKVAIDDFGTGFSSLSVLHKLPATRLKIDRAFVDAMDEDDSIAKMIVNLGQTLGLEVTAEGIETDEQFEKLKSFGCEEGQGWLFAKAMVLEELISELKQSKA
ncbi:EAL domain-containing protein [Vibrio genomosp. F10 str. 9ZC157]|uniref:Diguanylate phosphodiesterase n=1 Tax=Vibrio genomosp. F10 str. ZF-129 TaxID=1187848 RepID=A0A1E5BIX8_9VIBR|nr:EAL domain-containing protein [Vibrio genomosp. F10]OEE37353.1 diguanylate phosphodiesterase [Vibrio genomosp. F10 str. ZF-129]OEE95195.1 diguanylate phosphodiesterase [Vibrio genomosp. F10 str. 9ZC157]